MCTPPATDWFLAKSVLPSHSFPVLIGFSQVELCWMFLGLLGSHYSASRA